MQKKITCQICQREFNSICGLSSHIKPTHQISSKDYYDKFIKTLEDGFCLNCNTPTSFRDMGKNGYRKYCSKRCDDEYSIKQTKEKKQKELIDKEMIGCELCDGHFKNLQGLSNHIKQKHTDISIQKYYDEYLLKDVKEKHCKTCGKENNFYTIIKGYHAFCSRYCATQDNGRNKKLSLSIKTRKDDNRKKITPLLFDRKWLEEQYKTKTCGEIAKTIGVSATTVVRRMNEQGFDLYKRPSSSHENDIFSFLSDEFDSVSVLKNSKKIIPPLELDIYLPDYNLAIEFNGIYWHSEQNGKDRNYHLNKTNFCEEKDIQLLHIFENEWNEKQDIWKSIIRNKLGKNGSKVFARKCTVKEVSSKIANLFLDDNHLQGRDRSSIRLGLYHNDELVSLFTIGKSRYDKKYQYEILRFCNKLNTSIVGGFGKLYKYFERNYNPTSIITYADKRFSDGNLYNNFFEYSHDSKPNYFYKIGHVLHSRIAYQKHKLADKLELFDESLSEYQNMLLNGYDRIWDCGNKVYTKKY